MLYQLYETQRALLAPFSEFASASSKLYSHPLSPFTHTPKLPGSSWSVIPLLVLVGVALAIAVVGIIGVRRRDLACG